jgi:peptide/nickel transport system permease protein
VPLLLGVSIVVFLLTRVVITGDPVDQIVPPMASAEVRARVAAQYGLDQPLLVQYLRYVQRLLVFDLGLSMRSGQPVRVDLAKFFPATLELTTYAMILAFVVGVPLGVIAAIKKNTWVDHVARVVAVSGISVPVFWLALILIYLFFFLWQVSPAPLGRINPRLDAPTTITGLLTLDSLLTGNWAAFRSSVSNLVLPVVSLAYGAMAPLARMARTGMIEVLETQYIRTARAQGLRPRTVVLKYALKNAMLPVVTMVAVVYGFLLGGSVLVENIFSWPGLGRYAYAAIAGNDYAAVSGFVLYATGMYVVLFLITDLVYAALNPRIRL